VEKSNNTTITAPVLAKAKTLFDVAGFDRSGKNILLVLGLESTSERNLDDFGNEKGNFRLYGYEEHVQHRLDELLLFIYNAGFAAEAVGRIGYPLEGEINLKEAAIRIGIGKRGKNTVVLHPEYGPRLRFMGIITDIPYHLPDIVLHEEENPVCRHCNICIDSCPVNALEPYRMPEPKICLSYFTPRDEKGHSILCDLCLKLCPAGKSEIS